MKLMKPDTFNTVVRGGFHRKMVENRVSPIWLWNWRLNDLMIADIFFAGGDLWRWRLVVVWCVFRRYEVYGRVSGDELKRCRSGGEERSGGWVTRVPAFGLSSAHGVHVSWDVRTRVSRWRWISTRERSRMFGWRAFMFVGRLGFRPICFCFVLSILWVFSVFLCFGLRPSTLIKDGKKKAIIGVHPLEVFIYSVQIWKNSVDILSVMLYVDKCGSGTRYY